MYILFSKCLYAYLKYEKLFFDTRSERILTTVNADIAGNKKSIYKKKFVFIFFIYKFASLS